MIGSYLGKLIGNMAAFEGFEAGSFRDRTRDAFFPVLLLIALALAAVHNSPACLRASINASSAILSQKPTPSTLPFCIHSR
jgi:hypothetical protein